MSNISNGLSMLFLCGFICIIFYIRVCEYPEGTNVKFHHGSSLKENPNRTGILDDHPADAIASPLFSLAVTNEDLDNMRVVRIFLTF